MPFEILRQGLRVVPNTSFDDAGAVQKPQVDIGLVVFSEEQGLMAAKKKTVDGRTFLKIANERLWHAGAVSQKLPALQTSIHQPGRGFCLDTPATIGIGYAGFFEQNFLVFYIVRLTALS
jgi:hypothetical protein